LWLICLVTTWGILMKIGAMMVWTCMLSELPLRMEWRIIIFCGMVGVILMMMMFSVCSLRIILFIVVLMFGGLLWVLERWRSMLWRYGMLLCAPWSSIVLGRGLTTKECFPGSCHCNLLWQNFNSLLITVVVVWVLEHFLSMSRLWKRLLSSLTMLVRRDLITVELLLEISCCTHLWKHFIVVCRNFLRRYMVLPCILLFTILRGRAFPLTNPNRCKRSYISTIVDVNAQELFLVSIYHLLDANKLYINMPSN
jgi:hypothetical protein